MRLRPKFAFFPLCGGRRSGYTLVEILVATVLTLILMTAVVTVFGGVGDGISKSRRAMEQFDRLRTAAQQLRLDFQGITVKLDGRPGRPEENAGYFEVVDAGNAQNAYVLQQQNKLNPNPKYAPQWINGRPDFRCYSSDPEAVDSTRTNPDCTVAPRGDILMFTTRNALRPFVGRYIGSVDASNPTLQSDVAEVCWFLRGRTLHRRVLLVAPGTASVLSQYNNNNNNPNSQYAFANYYNCNDISVRMVQDPNNPLQRHLVPNSLADLTKRENRFGHPCDGYIDRSQNPPRLMYGFPFDVRRWGLLGLPTLSECTYDPVPSPGVPTSTWLTPFATTWLCGTVPFPPTDRSPATVPFPVPAVPPTTNFPNPDPQHPVNTVSQVDEWDDTPANDTINVKTLLSDNALNPIDPKTGQYTLAGRRVADDIVLTNVIGFDVKFWDPTARVYTSIKTNQTAKPGDLGYPDLALAAFNKSPDIVTTLGAYVDLAWGTWDPTTYNAMYQINPGSHFAGYGNPKAGMYVPTGNPYLPFISPASTWYYKTWSSRVYDTWSFSYENEGIYYFDVTTNPPRWVNFRYAAAAGNPNQPTWGTWYFDNPSNRWKSVTSPAFYPPGLNQVPAGNATNGLDDDGNGIVDDVNEQITSAPYPVPLRGIQIKIRCFEPDSRQIREITIEHDFLPK